MTKRAAVYCRVSTEEQAREGVSLDLQRRRCVEAAISAGYEAEAVEVFVDDGYTGTSTDRPALQRFLADLDGFSALYVWKLDRFARSVRDCANMWSRFKDHGVTFVSVSDSIDLSTPTGRVFAHVASAFAEFEADVIRARVRDALDELQQAGRKLGKPPYGYTRQAPKEPLAEHPEEAPVLQRVFREYAAGLSLTDVALGLNADGIPTREGNRPWSPSGISRMLSRRAYRGEQVLSSGLVVPGDWPALVDAGTWQTVQDRLASNYSVPPPARVASISPILKCGLCGGSVNRHTANGGKQLSYRCATRTYTPDAHPPLFRSAAVTETAIWDFVLEQITDGHLSEGHRRAQERAQRNAQRETGSRLVATRDDLRARLQRNAEAYQAGAIDRETLVGMNLPLRTELAAVEKRLEAEKPAPTDLPRLTKKDLQALRVANPETQRRFLQAVFERVELHPTHLRFVWRGGTEPTNYPLPEKGTGRWPRKPTAR